MISKGQSRDALAFLIIKVITILYLEFRSEVMEMWMNKETVNRAQERALENLDYVMECQEAPDFVEVTGSIGGDVVTYRVYDNGDMYAR